MLGSKGLLQRTRLWKPVLGLIAVMLTLGISALSSPAAHAGTAGTTLSPGQTLTAGQSLVDDNFSLVLGTDGNLVIDQYVPSLSKSFPIWPPAPQGTPART